jgi:integrase/recombinase XerD
LKCGEGSKSRIIPIENSLRESIFNYIETYKNKLSLEENSALFLNYSGKRISRQGFWKLMKKHSSDAGIDVDINAYVLKQTFFARLRR